MRKKHTIEEMQRIAKKRGGRCLSKKFINNNTKLKYRCKFGHVWKARVDHTRKGVWCPRCAIIFRANKLRSNLAEMKGLAKKNNGLCLSKKYLGSSTKLKWKCGAGHTWEANPNHIARGHWCPYCSKKAKLSIKRMGELANARGGTCLSKKYVNVKAKLLWRCKEGHKWKATPDHIIQGSWCPVCCNGIGEQTCRKVFELLFSENFPKKRLNILKNEKGNCMELDGYCEKLGLAFEYHGQQHYFPIGIFNKNRNLKQQKQDDALKERLCKKHKITLIIVPYYIEPDEMPRYIFNKCNDLGIKVSKLKKDKIDLINIYSREKIDEMKKLAMLKNGKCLSKRFLGSSRKIKWQCKFRHTWWATPSNINSGRWCPRCAIINSSEKRKMTIEQMREIANNNMGRCLSKKYVDSNTKLIWKCVKGHIWVATPEGVKQGRWCRKCAFERIANRRRLTIEEMREIAKLKGGECISERYVDSSSKLLWRCKKGHIWEALESNIKKGSWCPNCAGLSKITIEELRKFARNKRGRCLSTKSLGIHTNHIWQCKKKHIWKAIPSNIRRGHWCPYCAGKVKLTIEEMLDMARKYDGECLSKKYTNANSKLKWKCKEGHMWRASPEYIRQGYWCPICAHHKRKKK